MQMITQYALDRRKVAEHLVRQMGIREGHWSIGVEVSMNGTNMSVNGAAPLPTFVLQIVNFALHRHEKAESYTVDAAAINAEFPSEIEVS